MRRPQRSGLWPHKARGRVRRKTRQPLDNTLALMPRQQGQPRCSSSGRLAARHAPAAGPGRGSEASPAAATAAIARPLVMPGDPALLAQDIASVRQAHSCAVKHHQVSTQPRSSTCRLIRLVARLKSQTVTCMFGVAWVAASFQTMAWSAHSGRRWLAGSSGRRVWVLASARAIPVQRMPISRECSMTRACLQVLVLFCKGG